MEDRDARSVATAVVRDKLSPPRRRPSTVERPELVQRLEGTESGMLHAVIAPAGWGKTTLLRAWTDHTTLPTAWLTLDRFDNDPTRAWLHLLTAVGEAVDIDVAQLISRLRVSAVPLITEVVDPLLELISDQQLRVVLDDLHTIDDAGLLESFAALLGGAPTSVSFGLGSRSEPPIGLDRRRVAGDLVEIQLGHLRMSVDEARPLVEAAAGRAIDSRHVAELVRRTEGWPAGLSLAGLALRDAPDDETAVHRFTGDHRHVASYFATEVIERLAEEDRDFLRTTAALPVLHAELCDAVRGRTDSGLRLRDLGKSLSFLIPTAPNDHTFRRHQLFHDWLLAEASRLDPAALREAHRRAAVAHAARSEPVHAMAHAIESSDWRLASEIFTRFALILIGQGHHATVAGWCASFPDDIDADALIAVWLTQAWEHVFEGDADAAERVCRRLETIEPANRPPTSWTADPGHLAVIRAFCHQLRGDLVLARPEIDAARVHRVSALIELPLQFIAATTSYWEGHPDAEEFLEVARRAEEQNDPYAALLCHSFVAHIHLDALESKMATASVDQIFERAATNDLSTFWWGSAGHLARARCALLYGDNEVAVDAALVSIELAERRDDTLMSTFAHLVLAEALHAAGERPSARVHLSAAKDLLEPLRDSGVLGERMKVVERQLRLPTRTNVPRYSDVPVEDLTDREMALLRLLPGDLSQRELGRTLHVSFNTIKTHNRSIYRKLGVASRDDAVAVARASGLL